MAVRRKITAKSKTPKRKSVPRPRSSRSGKAKAKIRTGRSIKRTAERRVARRKSVPRKAPTAKPPVDAAEAIRALQRKVRRLGSARRILEKRLTAAVQEIGALRQFELRALMLEDELRKRDSEIESIRRNGVGPGAAP